MKRLMGLAMLSTALACTSNVDVGQGDTSSAIINGESCSAETEPTTVAVLVDATIDFGGFGQQQMRNVICTGTLIAPDVVLTAAHCLDASASTFGFGEVLEENYFISFEADLTALAEQTSQEFPADTVAARDFLPNPEFAIEDLNGETVNGPGAFKDVGLIFLDQPVTHVEPEIVVTAEESSQLSEGLEVIIAGWGMQVPTDGPFEAPPPGTVGVKQCAASFVNELGTHEFQVGADSSTSRKCHGDSGGPTFAVLDTPFTNDRRVIGITSHAYDAEDCNKGGIDTRVDAWLGWIDDEMRVRCENSARSWCDVDGIVPASFFEPTINPGEGEGEGEGEGRLNPTNDNPPGCSHVSTAGESAASIGLALFGLVVVLRRRR